jgi:phosphomethylpyrimidine synthase
VPEKLALQCRLFRYRCRMNITEDVRKYAAEQGIAEKEALKTGMKAKSKKFVSMWAEVYAQA